MPLFTLRLPPRGNRRKTRGQNGSLLLSCRTLSFPTACRFIPAHAQFWAQLAIFEYSRATSCFFNLLIYRELDWLRGRDLNPRPLGYEPTRVLARLFCSIIYVLLVPWFFLLFGRFCGRNVVGKLGLPRAFGTPWRRQQTGDMRISITLPLRAACSVQLVAIA